MGVFGGRVDGCMCLWVMVGRVRPVYVSVPDFHAAMCVLQLSGFANQTGGNAVDWVVGETLARLPVPEQTGPPDGRLIFGALAKSLDGGDL